MIVKAKLMQAIFTAIIIGLIYLNVDDKTGAAAIQDRTGVLFFLIINQVFGNSIGVLSIFGEEKNVFTREFGAGYYSLPAYFFSKISVELPFQIIFPFIMALIIYFMVGLQAVASKFFILEGFVILSSLCGFALGICFACIFSSLPVALAVTPLVLLPMMLFSGLFLNQGSIPAYVDWIKFMTPMKWGFSAIAINEYSGLQLKTDSGTLLDGSTVIKQLALDQGYMTIGNAAIILGAMVIFLMTSAYYALHSQTVDAMKSIRIVDHHQDKVKVEIKSPQSEEQLNK
jgi:ABC-type multidrug transport system permease subunit